VAIIIALQWVEEVRPDRVISCTDSLAAIKSIQSVTSVREDLLIEMFHSLFRLHRGGMSFQFCWVPDEGVNGNEIADKLAKEALQIQIPLGNGDGKVLIKNKGIH